MRSMLTIGLLGGIASGKSTVARLLSEHGAVVLDADAAAGEALRTEEVRAAIRQRWGDGVFDASDKLARGEIARRIFGPGEEATAERRFLEGLIHPRVRRALKAERQRLQAADAPVVVLDIPLLLEAGWAEECDLLLLVDAPDADRRARAAERGWDPEQLSWREAAQAPMSEKRRRADTVIANDGPIDQLRDAVQRFWTDRVAPGLTSTN